MRPTYTLRNILLLQLGFSNYVDYLASQLWAEIRDAVLNRDNQQCRLCGKGAHVVHHIDYSEPTMRGEAFEGLVSVCHDCHKRIEFTKDGKKRLLHEAVKEYRLLSKKTKKPNNRKICVDCVVNTARKNAKVCGKCIRKRGRHRCIRCGNAAKRNTTMCRPCLKVSKTA